MTERIASASVETSKRSVARKVLQAAIERWHAGVTSPDARRVLADHPNLAELKSIVVDLAYEEYCARSDAGEQIDREEFCARFPEYQSSICRRLAVHDFFTAEPAFPIAGDHVLGLRLVDELGRGALARVFLAEESELGGRLVAVKFAHYGQYEADFLGRLQHPNIVPVHSVKFDSQTGLSAVVMPYLGDKTLGDVKIGSLDEVLAIFAQLADALAYTHKQQILHRDLKPSNVLMGERPMLMDFNLSADLSTELERVGGTLHYMAPEQRAQLGGEAAEVDGRADIYSLGVMLNELLAPFAVPRRVRTIVERCTAERPEDRFAAADALATELRRELRPIPKSIRWGRRRPFSTAMIFLALIGALFAAGIAYRLQPTPLERAQAHMAEGRTQEAVDILLSIEPRTAEVLFTLGRARLLGGDPDAAFANFGDAYRMSKDGRYAACRAYAGGLAAFPPGGLSLWHKFAREAGFDSPEMQNNEGYCLRRQGKDEEAKALLEKALAAKPDLAPAIFNLALVNAQLAMKSGGNIPRDVFWDALEHCPESDALYQHAALATILSDMHDPERTEVTLSHIEKALSLGINVKGVGLNFPMLAGNQRFKELLSRRWEVKRVPPVFLCDPLDEFPAIYPAKND